MSKPWWNELRRIAVLLLTGIVVGTIVGDIPIGLLIITTTYLGWHLYNLYRLLSCLREGKKLPAAGDRWYLGRCVRAHLLFATA